MLLHDTETIRNTIGIALFKKKSNITGVMVKIHISFNCFFRCWICGDIVSISGYLQRRSFSDEKYFENR